MRSARRPDSVRSASVSGSIPGRSCWAPSAKSTAWTAPSSPTRSISPLEFESLTKVYRVGILISQNTYDRLADPKAYDIRPIDIVVVKGKTQPVTLFEVFNRNDPAERTAKARTRDHLLSGVGALIRLDTKTARQHFEASLALLPGDPASANLLKSCD